jgi:hypothetical protein
MNLTQYIFLHSLKRISSLTNHMTHSDVVSHVGDIGTILVELGNSGSKAYTSIVGHLNIGEACSYSWLMLCLFQLADEGAEQDDNP